MKINKKLLTDISKDFAAILAICTLGYFLIGYYLGYTYLDAGYDDWFMHAYRIKLLQEEGLSSWSHVWNNGINIWRGYQFYYHWVILFASSLLKVSITKAMIGASVFVFLFLRVFTYILLRFLKISRLIALSAVLLSYSFSHQWITIKDFSIYMALWMVPLYVYIFIKSINARHLIYILSALAGVSWLLHPILGYTFSGVLFFYLIFEKRSISYKRVILSLFILALTSIGFFTQMFLYGYSYANPIFRTTQFLRDTLRLRYMGFGMYYFIFLLVVSIGWFVKATSVKKWATYLLSFCLLSLIGIYLGLQGYLPASVNALQITRMVTLIALILVFPMASVLQTLIKKQTILVKTLFVIFIAIIFTHSTTIASQYSADLRNEWTDPVKEFVKEEDIKGSVYYPYFTQSNYFLDKKVRFMGSYKEHDEQSPLGQRFKKLMRQDVAYTGVSEKQIDLIKNYSQVLGMQYLFLPANSPLVISLVSTGNFSNVKTIDATYGNFAVLQTSHDPSYAWVFDEKDREKIFSTDTLKAPGLESNSFEAWDEEIIKINTAIEDELLKPITVQFLDSESVLLDLSKISDYEKAGVLLNLSYSQKWQADTQSVELIPTSTRFMYIKPIGELNSKKLILEHNWPDWHFPSIYVSFASLPAAFLVSFIDKRRSQNG